MAAGGQPGNKNATKNKIWSEELRKAALQDRKQLRRIAETLLKQAEAGDIGAIKELGDRLEGKAVARNEVSGPDGGPIHLLDVVGDLPDPDD